MKGLSLILVALMILSPNMVGVEAQPGSGFNTAMEITPGVYSYYIGRGKSHYYKVNVSSGEVLTITMDVPSAQDFDLYLYDADQNEIASSTSTLQGGEERIEYTPRISGIYYIRVAVVTGDGTYSLTVSISNFKVIYTGWGDVGSPREAGPGDVGVPLSVTVRVESDYTVTSLTATLTLDDAFTNSTNGSLAKAYYNSTVSPGGTATFTFTLNIASDAELSTHTMTMTIDYYLLSDSELVQMNPVDLQVNVDLPGKSFLEIEASNQFLTAGNTTQVVLSISNTGTAKASSIELSLTVPSPLTLGGKDDRWLISSLGAGESTDITCDIYAPLSSQDNTYQVTVSFTYDTVVGTEKSDTRTLIFTVEEVEGIIFQVEASGQTLKPGSTNELTLTITNTGSLTASSIQLTLSLPSPLSLREKDDLWSLSPLAPQQSSSITAEIYAPSTTGGSTYLATLTLEYKDPSGKDLSETRSISLTVAEVEGLSFTVTASGQSLIAGRENTLTLEVTNEGSSPAYDLKISVDLPAPLTLVGRDNKWSISKLDPLEGITLTLDIFSPLESLGTSSKATLTITYETEEGVEFTDTRSIGLTVSEAVEDNVVFSLATEDYDLTATLLNDVDIDVYNIGEASARSVTLTLDLPQGLSIIGSGNVWFVQEIPLGGKTRLSVKIYVPAKGLDTTYQATLTITYKDEQGNERTDIETLGFSVKGFIDLLVVDVTKTPSPAIVNRSLTLAGTIVNEGIITAKAVNISVAADEPFISTDESSMFIGDILTGGETPFSITCDVGNAAPDIYPLRLILNYKDDRNIWHTLEKRVFVEVAGGALSTFMEEEIGGEPLGIFGLTLYMLLGSLVGIGVAAPITLILYRRYLHRSAEDL